MTLPAPENLALETLAEVPCHQCGYDVRAHAADGVCPECAASVAESRRVAAIPVRPKWADSDPRWRRRMLAGVWLLVMVPLVDVVSAFGWGEKVLMPNPYGSLLAGQTLRDTMVFWSIVYQPVVMCMGLVLLFSPERGRRTGRMDWVQRWGVLGCYLVLFLAAVEVLFITALVTAGIAALLMSIAVDYQPGVTELVVDLGYGYLRFGPSAGNSSWLLMGVLSSLTVMLACVRLYDALRATGDRWSGWLAMVPPGVLAAIAVLYLTRAAGYALAITGGGQISELRGIYFETYPLEQQLVRFWRGASLFPLLTLDYLMEMAKWGAVLTIAIWLSVAQFLAWRAGKRAAKL